MKKKLLIAGIALLLILVIAGFFFWQWMSAPLYVPGTLRTRAILDPPKQAGEASYWQVEPNIRLSFTTQGEGRPIVVVHGGPGYPVHPPLPGLDSLTTTHKLFFYDQRGCGQSTKPFDRFSSKNYYANMKELEGTLGIGAQVADIERIRRILGQEKLILMGHSFGGFLATMYAAEFPERVEALVLVAPAGVLVMPEEQGGFFEEIRKHLSTDKQAEYDQFMKNYLDFGSIFSKSEAELAAMNRRVGEYFLIASGRAGEVNQPKPPEDNGGWMVQAQYFSMGKKHDYRQALKAVRARSLIILGESDVIPEQGSRLYPELLPNARLHIMKNAQTRGGHFPFSEQPAAFAKVVSEFVNQK